MRVSQWKWASSDVDNLAKGETESAAPTSTASMAELIDLPKDCGHSLRLPASHGVSIWALLGAILLLFCELFGVNIGSIGWTLHR